MTLGTFSQNRSHIKKNTSVFVSLGISLYGVWCAFIRVIFHSCEDTITCGVGLNCCVLRNYVGGCRIIDVN